MRKNQLEWGVKYRESIRDRVGMEVLILQVFQ
jgi:hypothetical protein